MIRRFLYCIAALSCVLASQGHMIECSVSKSITLRDKDVGSGITCKTSMQMYFDHVHIENYYRDSVFKCYFLNPSTSLFDHIMRKCVVRKSATGKNAPSLSSYSVSVSFPRLINNGVHVVDDRDVSVNISSTSKDWIVYDVSSELDIVVARYLNFKLYLSIAVCELGVYNFIKNDINLKKVGVSIAQPVVKKILDDLAGGALAGGDKYTIFITSIEDYDVLSVIVRSIDVGLFASVHHLFSNNFYLGVDLGFSGAVGGCMIFNDVEFSYQMSDLKNIQIPKPAEISIDDLFDVIDVEMREGRFAMPNAFKTSCSLRFGSKISNHISVSNIFSMSFSCILHDIAKLDSKVFNRWMFGYGVQISYGRF